MSFENMRRLIDWMKVLRMPLLETAHLVVCLAQRSHNVIPLNVLYVCRVNETDKQQYNMTSVR